MQSLLRPTALRCTTRRGYTSAPAKVPIKLIAELRKQTTVSLDKAREALSQANGDIPKALEWLKNDLITTGAKKAAKVASRTTGEGVIGVSVISQGLGAGATASNSSSGSGSIHTGGVRGAIVELNCETDFVARNELFARLAQDIAHTAAFVVEPSPEYHTTPFRPLSLSADLLSAPLVTHDDPARVPTGDVASAIRDTIVKVGENISLRRASVVAQHTFPVLPRSLDSATRLGSYVHGTLHGLACGRVAGLALLNLRAPELLKFLAQQSFNDELSVLQRAIARQIVGFDTPAIRRVVEENYGDAQPLYEQPFVTLPGEFQGLPVEEALRKWAASSGLASEESAPGAVEVLRFLKWTVGEPLEEPSEDSASPYNP
ncbi:hypothetical protein M413DRAFT_22168 [Hebeloma cylindrosporum]|uniref:Elongation factor Ts, mitochondrial n=1 Tax=Hebeloma cylindrosporum TaxID=76867 RepID=A0A0C2Z2M5_HEBCY|nr:hypothetical protein M413DRAFT_22168 [Hebeloma cylindrosporum h7]